MTGQYDKVSILKTAAAPDALQAVLAQLDSVILGKPQQVRLSLACLLAGGHLLIEDSPGVGKTTLAHALAATLGLDWKRLQFTSDLLPADVTGVSIFDTRSHDFRFHAGPVFTQLLLADEINRAPPKTQSALLEAMEERQVTSDGQTRPLPAPFFVIATQNPADRMGAYGLPESQLDRFLVGIELGYPDAAAERALLAGGSRRNQALNLQPLAGDAQIQRWQDAAAGIFVSDAILDYIQALLEASRNEAAITLSGLSPRAGVNLVALSRAWALLNGREMVLPEDVQSVFVPLAGHRLTGSVSEGKRVARNLLDLVAVDRDS
ncbi:MoxR family ATPase [Granulosicoccaceae sp. 1_MG-2023]|nr:MoxR family ATPase [Granulosicoccaceae sp. 1_MG-2023]